MGKKVDRLVGGLAKEAERDAEREANLEQRRKLAKSEHLRKTEERRRKEAEAALEESRLALEVAIASSPPRRATYTIESREPSSPHEATAVLLVSDLHPEETVSPDTVSDLNEFDLAIARERMERLFIGAKWMIEALRDRGGPGFVIRDLVLGILGDLITNTIHPELLESNALGPADATIYVTELLRGGIDYLLRETDLERIYCPCVHGNHDRMTPKMRHSTKAANSLATIVYHQLAQLYADEPRVEFDIARGSLLYTEVYGHTIRWTHGDDVRYWGGVGGITIPLRKAIDSWDKSRPAHLTCLGHFHQVTDHRDFVVNGSLIGYSAFAQAIKARFEPAAQAFFLLDRRRGKRMFSPVQVQDTGGWS